MRSRPKFENYSNSTKYLTSLCAEPYVKDLMEYCNQLEEELKKYKQKPKIKQIVVRTFTSTINTTGNLEKKLNQGYHVVMANHIGTNNSIEYILEKEVIQDEKTMHN